MRQLQLYGFILLILSLSACGNRPLAPVGTLNGDTGQTTKSQTTQANKRPQATASQGKGYIVKPGDTLYSISWRYRQDYKKLASYNGINPPYTIHVGQRLRIPTSKVAAIPKQQNKPTSTPATVTHPSAKQITWRWPLRGKIIENYSASEPGNKGIDIAGKPGELILAAAAGKVVYSGNGLPRYGNLLIVKHDDVYLSAYAHNQTLLVKEGQWVAAGQKIALLGKTGTQRHKLHFEIRYDGRPINPLQLLPKRQ